MAGKYFYQFPIPNHQSPVTNHQSPITNYQSPVTNHQSPITSHQSPIPNHQSPITNYQKNEKISFIHSLNHSTFRCFIFCPYSFSILWFLCC
ncbi:hypothetical protein H6F47_12785 [Sphaerospermopsis sp. FACHB-1094]|nr:hypothetical protein [Sphaerospermopsis sp. FACHB-1094]MBD2133281.1 hypothetical protein [Sphaerospermopsis sp. FACHB-1094]